MAETSRRIGLILASIHTGASIDFWSDIAHVAQEAKGSLFVFPVGRLAYPKDFEYLRNSLSSLANTKNLDGLISWGSSLGGAVSIDEVKDFHSSFGSLPCVTIGMNREGFPNISFDAYAGIQNQLIHCIKVHHASKIAFIRGPENHLSSNDRFQAYKDVLENQKIAYDPLLVSDPFGWTEGAKALDQLVSARHLIPGKDFDTLSCSSDLMMFGAGKVLEAMGIRIPEDLRIVGFNNSRESRLLKVPCTTAKMPVQRMAFLSWAMVEEMLEKHTFNGPDILLPAECVVRRSCGCVDSLGGYLEAKKILSSENDYIEWLEKAFGLSQKTVQRKIRPLLELASKYKDVEDTFLAARIEEAIQNLAYRFLDSGGDPNQLSEALSWYELFFANLSFKKNFGSSLRDMFLRQQDLVSNEHAYAVLMQKKKLNSLECDLLCIRSIQAIPTVLEAHLPALGIPQCYLVTHQNDELSCFVGGFDATRVYLETELFPKDLLLPLHFSQLLAQGVYVIEPLFMENQPLGYLVIRTEVFDGNLMEELRTALSSALKGTFLVEAANSAREQAEHAQRLRKEFFANVSEGLRNPLDTILQLFKNIPNEDRSDEKIKQIIGAMEDEVSKANHLLDLTLSQTGALGFDIQVFNASSLVQEFLAEGHVQYEGSLELPALRTDRQRLREILSIVRTQIISDDSICLLKTNSTTEGLEFALYSTSLGWKAELYRQNPGFLLAERIVLMSGGIFSCQGNSVRFRLPWPGLGSDEPVLSKQGPSFPYYITEREEATVPIAFAAFEPIQILHAPEVGRKGGIPSSIGQILWDAQENGLDQQLALHVLGTDSLTSLLPFICLGCPDGFPTIREALESNGAMQTQGTVFVFGDFLGELTSLAFQGSLVKMTSLGQFEELALQAKPSLLISCECNVSQFTAIRKGRVAFSVPIVIIKEIWTESEIEELSLIPNILIVNTSIADSKEFLSRLIRLRGNDSLLPSLTGILVKRAVVYLSLHASSQVSRWQLAEAVNVSEDYLTRIFRKEIGLSPWDYLNRHRIFLAENLLRQTGLTINEIASQTGFQDQAYFCRVFKKIKGLSPGFFRSINRS
ncbi:helix-turn-helix domain-containing protein [uncultured Sphaerochaeta sp.]|uniref:helix-turn-helix domain-containing protein n=1 Tax=uncultured Sphaerochaeta sp. TaxID=886478 RepID=UPI002A0A7BE5|nr:helix-turn-helix domain-containing protein [uncultured Sphaerochaeta sp.]